MAQVADLYIHPLKSGRSIAKSAVRLVPTGFEWDRHWLAVDAANAFLTQRTHARLALVEPRFGDETLTLHAPGLQPFELPLAPSGEEVPVQIWRDRCVALDQGDLAAEWLSEAVRDSVRLVRMAPNMDRMANREYARSDAPVSFQDGFPLLVCNQASLDHLNTMLPEALPMERFRPNIVLTGLPAFAEDRIAELHFPEITLRLVKPCTRCVIPSIDQRTAERSVNPLPVLRKFRFDKKLLGVTFGENAVIDAGVGASLARGDECDVIYDN